MTRTRQDPVDPYLTGYRAPIYRATWERICTAGAPRMLSAVWLVLCLYGVVFLLFLKQPQWIPLVIILWLLVQGIFVLLTQWDTWFDEVLMAAPRYRTFYDAGS
jgi:type IV secretory pathway TrbD component